MTALVEAPDGVTLKQVNAAAAARETLLAAGATLTTRPWDSAAATPYHPRPYGPARFTWGKVVAVHRVGGYVVIEFDQHATGEYDPMVEKDRALTGELSFHPWVDGEDTGHSWRTLDAALIGCVAWRHERRLGGRNAAADSRAVRYISRMIGMEA